MGNLFSTIHLDFWFNNRKARSFRHPWPSRWLLFSAISALVVNIILVLLKNVDIQNSSTDRQSEYILQGKGIYCCTCALSTPSRWSWPTSGWRLRCASPCSPSAGRPLTWPLRSSLKRATVWRLVLSFVDMLSVLMNVYSSYRECSEWFIYVMLWSDDRCRF